jgi:hypothetical protein
MDPETSADRRAVGLNGWIVWVTVGLFVFLFVATAVEYVNTGRMRHPGIAGVAICVSTLLSRVSDVPQRSVVRWLLRSGALAAMAVGTYMLFRSLR